MKTLSFIFFVLLAGCKLMEGREMKIEALEVGPLGANCYIVADRGEAIVIDPGDEPDRIMDALRGLKVKYIVLTHAHFDHAAAVPEIKAATGAKIALHEDEMLVYEAARDMAAFWGYDIAPLPPPDLLLREGSEFTVGKLLFVVLHTPGHSPGGISLYGEDVVFTGDTLFAGSIGRTDFPGGDLKKMKASFRKLLSLPDKTRVLAGHGPASTIGREKTQNMFVGEFLF